MLIYRLITTLDRNNLLEFPQNHATLQQGIWSRSFFLFYFLLLLSPFERSLLTLKDVLLIPCVQVMSYSSKLVNLLLIFFRRKFLSNFKIGVKYLKSLKAREKN